VSPQAPCGSSRSIFPCISRIGIGENYAVQSLTFGLHSILTPMTLVTFKTRILYEATSTMPTLYSRLWLLPPPFSFKHPTMYQTTTWLGVTRPVAGHPLSVLSHVIHQSNFHILSLVVSIDLDLELICFRVHPPPLAGSSTTVHSSLIGQNTPPCCVCSPLSACQVASVWTTFDGLC